MTFEICFLKEMFVFPAELPDESNASNWTISVEQCKQSTLSYYLLGDVNLTNPHDECIIINHKSDVFWLGVARQTYTSIDQGILHISS